MGRSCSHDFELKSYYNDLKKFKPLKKADEHKLYKEFKYNNNLEARDMLITSNLKFVVDVAKQYKGRGLSLRDLVAEGNLGLIKALDKYNPEKDVKFISYGVWWIRSYINEAIKRKNNFPMDDLPSEYDKLVDDCSENTIDGEDNRNDDVNLTDFPTHSYDEEELGIVPDLLETLNEREKNIIKSYFGIDCDELTLEEIGEKLNLTKERVRQIKEKAMLKLRSNMLLIGDKY